MAEGERIIITRTKAILNREQKTGLGMVIGFGSLGLVFGVFFLWKHVAAPFVISYTGPQFLTGDEKQQQEMEKLKKQDTDADTINDYSELYVYKTSPYLRDSDSDGTEDAVEIAQGQDPNCAPSMPCATAATDVVNPETLQGTFIQSTSTEAPTQSLAASAEGNIDIEATLAAMTTDEIRALLIQAGGDAVAIGELSDEELRAALAAAFAQMQSEGAGTDTPTETSADPTQPTQE